MDLGIQGKVTLITGGSRGLGKASALSLAKEGATIGICSRDKNTIANTVQELQNLGVTAKGFVADISDLNQLKTLHSKITRELGEKVEYWTYNKIREADRIANIIKNMVKN